jgi:hypothetical protein
MNVKASITLKIARIVLNSKEVAVPSADYSPTFPYALAGPTQDSLWNMMHLIYLPVARLYTENAFRLTKGVSDA